MRKELEIELLEAKIAMLEEQSKKDNFAFFCLGVFVCALVFVACNLLF